MLRNVRQFLAANLFGIALWSSIGGLVVLSLHRPAPTQALGFSTGGGSGPEIEPCQILADIDDYFCGEDIRPAQDTPAGNIRFEPNVGQGDAGYAFLANGRGHQILLSESETVFKLRASRTSPAREIHASLEGARTGLMPRAELPLSGRVNYLIGRDPKNWHTDLPTFGRVTFAGVYPDIDVAYFGTNGSLENDFIVHPGGDPEAIRIHFRGQDAVNIESDGSLTVQADQRSLTWKKPLLYQVGAHGAKARVEGRFKILPDGAVGFEVGVYDLKRPLIIDPPLVYATYFGSPDAEAASRVAVDSSGNAYLVGGTDNVNFPSTPNVVVSSKSGLQGQVLLAKMAPDGKTLIYETHIGGSGGDVGWGIALDSTGNVYITGMTASADYPLQPATNNLTTKSITDPMNCFVSELNSAGNALIYSTLIGGSAIDGCSTVGVDSAGNTYVAGTTNSTDLPTVNALQPSAPGSLFGTASYGIFVVKLPPGGGPKPLYATYYGGPGNNAATSMAVDSSGNAYLTGFTTSSAFSTSSGVYQQTFGGSGGQNNSIFTTGDAFVLKLNSSGQRVYATYLGGAKDDIGMGIAVDSAGNAYVGGATLSTNFPTQNAFQSANHGSGGSAYAAGGDGFIAELDPNGANLLFSSYIGGTSDDRVLGIALDSSNNIYLAGHTISSNFPTAGTQAQTGYAGDNSGVFHTGDAFLAEVSGTSHALTFSTYLGGSGGDWAGGVAVDPLGGITIAGGTNSSDFPATQGSYQPKFAGTDTALAAVPFGDAFLARFGSGTPAVLLSGISNAASYAGGGIAPGEAVLLAGSGIGPSTLAGAALTSTGSLATTIANTTFTFNGHPAPVVYVQQQYSSVIVPYEIAGSSSVQIVATVGTNVSPAMTVPVVTAIPGIFTANASGTGAAAVRNQDGSINSAQSPAPRGSIITIYLTGEGQTVPPGVTGSVTASLNITPALTPVTALFGGVPATSYQYVGEAPGEVAGVMQINVTIPQLAPTGNSVPLMVSVGTYNTQSGVTIAIQ